MSRIQQCLRMLLVTLPGPAGPRRSPVTLTRFPGGPRRPPPPPFPRPLLRPPDGSLPTPQPSGPGGPRSPAVAALRSAHGLPALCPARTARTRLRPAQHVLLPCCGGSPGPIWCSQPSSLQKPPTPVRTALRPRGGCGPPRVLYGNDGIIVYACYACYARILMYS